ncbi:AraC family transcriptional regulator [Pseudoteredinibacter isoporae]|uniref:AraC family transcriptional regulator n=1 Tax=Pseudoteredinibacter isoporae TaxID=570281 RepID=UPI00310BF25D
MAVHNSPPPSNALAQASTANGAESIDMEPTLSSHFIVYLRDYLLDKQLPLEVLDEVAHVIEDIDDSSQLPLSQITELFNRVAELADDDFLGLNIGKRYHYESAGMIILLMLSAPSVEQGILALERYDKHFDSAINIDFKVRTGEAVFSVNLLNPKHVKTDHINEYLLVFLAQALSMATRKPMPCKEVWFEHASDKDIAPLQAMFSCPVKMGKSCNRIVFESDYLKEKFYTSNSGMFEIMGQMMRAYSFSHNGGATFLEALSREIVRLSKEGPPSLDEVATALNISSRTLRRRLAEQGYSFAEVKKQARESQARFYLNHTNLTLSEIAFELGYSELSAFSRAFRSWTGVSPQSFREEES